jgi:hypothetical protein
MFILVNLVLCRVWTWNLSGSNSVQKCSGTFSRTTLGRTTLGMLKVTLRSSVTFYILFLLSVCQVSFSWMSWCLWRNQLLKAKSVLAYSRMLLKMRHLVTSRVPIFTRKKKFRITFIFEGTVTSLMWRLRIVYERRTFFFKSADFSSANRQRHVFERHVTHCVCQLPKMGRKKTFSHKNEKNLVKLFWVVS